MIDAVSKDEELLPAWILTVITKPEHEEGLPEWLVKVMLVGIESPGYVNAEILPPSVHETKDRWTLLQRFQTAEQVDHWQTSNRLVELIGEVQQRIHSEEWKLDQHKVENYQPPTNVATAIVTHIKPGKEAEYRDWVGEIHVAQTKAPGYRGTFLQASASGSKAPWTTLLRFNSTACLDSWFESDERARLIAKASHLLRYDLIQVTSAFPGWFPTAPGGHAIARYKTAMLVLLVLYPLLIIRAIAPPLLPDWPPELSLFISLCISVSLISLVLMPIAIKVFKFWLFPSGHNPKLESIKGYLLLAALYAVEIGIAHALMPPTK